MTTTQVPEVATVGRPRHHNTAARIAPHVLHHVGPLAGAAILAGTGGRVLFFFVGLALAIPMLFRLYRRFRTRMAPAIAVAIFVVTYALSSIFLGPLISGATDASADAPPPATATTDQHGHTISP
jgi:hypothetical protein